MIPTPNNQPFQSRLLECSRNVEEAVSQLHRFHPTLQALSQELEQLGFQFSATQLLSPQEDIIETVFGVGIARAWEGLAKHYLEQDEELRDIHADIVIKENGITEIITGWDPRFDSWIYKTFDHKDMSRVFVPIMLVYDPCDHLVESWYQNDIFEIFEEEKNEEPIQGLVGYRKRLRPRLEGMRINTFGTVEAGICRQEESVSIGKAIGLIKIVSEYALRIRKCQLLYILKSIVNEARHLSGSNSASIHYLYNPENGKYFYETSSGNFDHFWFKNNPPRIGGLGRMAIEEKIPKCNSSSENQSKESDIGFQKLNPRLFATGVISEAAIPIIIDDCEEDIFNKGPFSKHEGVLYIYFNETHEFSDTELEAQKVLATQAQWAIRYTNMYEKLRDTNLRFKSLHSVVAGLANLSENREFLRHLAWNVVNLLAADVVSIYEYIETEHLFVTPPTIGGRIKFMDKMVSGIQENDAPMAFLRSGKLFHFASPPQNDKIFDSRKRKDIGNYCKSFIERENIYSVAALPLIATGEIVGIMFINFRRPYLWSSAEREIVDFLGSSAAIAIKKQRMLESLTYIDKELVQTLDLQKVLESIVEHVAHLMGFSVQARIFLVSADGQEVHLKAEYPFCRISEQQAILINSGEGIIGKIAQEGISILANKSQLLSSNLVSEKAYSALVGVPLLDREGEILGVLSVSSDEGKAFNKQHQRVLEAFANHAVIAIKNSKNQRKLVAVESLATLGDLASNLIHQTGGGISGIKEINHILNNPNLSEEEIKKWADHLHKISSSLFKNIEKLESLEPEKTDIVSLRDVLEDAIDDSNVPADIRVLPYKTLFEKPSLVIAPKQQLVFAFSNLISNAVEAMPNGGELKISATTLKLRNLSFFEIEIQDTGVGIPKKDINKIFQKDYTRKVRGGFGLWWTKILIEDRLNGCLAVDSIEGEGTKVKVRLPAYPRETLHGISSITLG